MSKRVTFVDLVLAALMAQEGKRLTARQLAELIVAKNPDWVAKKRSKSKNPAIRDGDDSDMMDQVQSEVGSNRPGIEKHPDLRTTEDRPRRYYYTSLSDEEEVDAAESQEPSQTSSAYSEHDLYPLLSEFLWADHTVYAKRIEEKKSGNRHGEGGNQWLHPDLIGLEILSENWSDTVRQLAVSRSDPTTRIWSFEVKKLINRSNVRKVFFQSVSNSAWANLGYLVAAEVSGKGTLEELRMLSAQHGIGVILLSTDQIAESTVLIQAKERNSVDWTAADRLSSENPDAEAFFNEVRVYHQAGHVNKQFWES